MSALPAARTCNQAHVARKYTPGKCRMSITFPEEFKQGPEFQEEFRRARRRHRSKFCCKGADPN